MEERNTENISAAILVALSKHTFISPYAKYPLVKTTKAWASNPAFAAALETFAHQMLQLFPNPQPEQPSSEQENILDHLSNPAA